MPLYRPFPTQPSSPFSLSRPVCLFLLADGCPYFSLYPLRTQRLETPLPFPLSFLSIQLSISPSHIFFSLYFFFSLFLSSIFLCLPTSPPSDTAVPSLPRTDRCRGLVQRHLYCPFFSLSSRLLPLFPIFALFLSSSLPLLCSISSILQSLDKGEPIMKNLSVDDELGFLLPVLLDLCWLDVVRCLDVTS